MISDWRQMNSELFEALAVEQVAMFVILCIIILVAAFNIASSLIMLVRAKTRDIAILRTMGATRGAMVRIFMTVGTTIGALGTIAGLILGFVAALLPPADRRFRAATVGAESVGSVDPVPDRIAVQAQPGRDHRGGADRARC